MKMKAIRVEQFGGPEVLKLLEIPIPNPAQEGVLVRVHAVGVNPVDTYIRAGHYANRPVLPYTPGSDAAGVVEAVGDQVTDFRPGDPVYTAGTLSGSYAEFTLCQAAQVHQLPSQIPYSQGAAIGVPYATAYRGLFHRGCVGLGELVLVHGASGGVGTAALQLARAHGLEVWGTAGTEIGLTHVLEQGATRAFDHGSAEYMEQIAQAAKSKGLTGVDLILEMLANRNLGRDLKLLAPFGRVVVIGSRGPVEIDPRDLMGRDADIRGLLLFNATAEELSEIHSGIIADLENGRLSPVVSREIPLAEADRAHQLVLQSGALGKIVLIP